MALTIVMMGSSLLLVLVGTLPRAYNQRSFVLSFFVDPQPTEANYQLISNANMTTVLQEHDIHDAASRTASIALAEKHGLEVIALDDSTMVDGNGTHVPLPNSSAVAGVYVRDEPRAADFPILRRLVDEVRRHNPQYLSFINLLPNAYAPNSQAAKVHLGVASYQLYLQQFVDVVDPDVICFDYYPEFGHGLLPPPGSAPWATHAGGNDTRQTYLSNLAAVRNASLAASIPMWNYFGMSAFNHHGQTHADATEAQMRWQVSASLAYGSRGLLYFFFTPNVRKVKLDGPEWPGLVRDDSPANHPTEHWYQAKRINSAVLALAPVLMQLRSTVALVLRQADTQHGGHAALRDSSCGLCNISQGDFIVGCFVRADTTTAVSSSSSSGSGSSNGRPLPVGGSWSRAVILANFEFGFTQWPTIDLGSGPVLDVDEHSGLAVPLEDEVTGLAGLQIGLVAGGRRLLLLKSDDDEICLVGYGEVYTLDAALLLRGSPAGLPSTTLTRWSWNPSADGTIRTNNLSHAFNGTVDCKPIDLLPTHLNGHSTPPVSGRGMQLLIVSDTGGVAIVDRASQRVVFCAFVPGAHSATLLSGGIVAVVASHLDDGDRVALFSVSTGLDPRLSLIKQCQHAPMAEAPVPGAHGVAWLNETRRLIVVGGSSATGFLYTFSLVDARSDDTGTATVKGGHTTKLNLTHTLKLGDAKGPHDLSPYFGPGVSPQSGPCFSLTALNGVWLYCAGVADGVVPHPVKSLALQTEVKSVSSLHNGTLMFVVEDRKGDGPAHFRSHRLHFIDGNHTGTGVAAWNVSLPSAWLPVYKARFIPALDLTTAGSSRTSPILQRPIFVPHEGGFICYRGLTLLSAGPSCIIAASEGRAFYNPNTTHCGGATPKALTVKTSKNGGQSWGPLQVAMHDNLTDSMTAQRLDLGSGVFDKDTKMVHIHYSETTQPPGGHTSYINAPHFVISGAVDEEKCTIDWSHPRDITSSERLSGMPANYHWVGCCGSGFQLNSKRLVVPGYWVQDNVPSSYGHRKGEYNDSVRVAAFLSDDGGMHWRPGNSAPHNMLPGTNQEALTSEVAILELANGSLLFNSDSCGLKHRLQSLSTDAGDSWGKVYPVNIVDDGEEGGFVSVVVTLHGHEPQELVVQSTGQGPGYRQDIHLFVSIDGGASYRDVRQWGGGCGYSELHVLEDSGVARNDTTQEGPTIGLFYEGGSGTTDYSGQMSFVRIDSAALLRAYLALEDFPSVKN